MSTLIILLRFGPKAVLALRVLNVPVTPYSTLAAQAAGDYVAALIEPKAEALSATTA